VNLWHLYNLYTRAKLVSPIICVGQFNHQNQLENRCKPNSLSKGLEWIKGSNPNQTSPTRRLSENKSTTSQNPPKSTLVHLNPYGLAVK
jgi:hypothetical protein